MKFFERKEIKDTLAYLRAAFKSRKFVGYKKNNKFPGARNRKSTLAKIFAEKKETLPIKMKIKIDNFYKTLEEIKEKIETCQKRRNNKIYGKKIWH